MKDKKKILIPMIIGILVLVVAVVGATFAFFSADNTASGTTNLEATTEAVGVVTVSNPTVSMHLNLTAYDMQESRKGVSYYATATEDAYVNDKEYATVARLSIAGGNSTTTYDCMFKMYVTPPTSIKAGDMSLYFGDGAAETIAYSDGLVSQDKSEWDLSRESYTEKGYSDELGWYYEVYFSTTGNTTSDLVKVALGLNNTTTSQDHLIGQDLITTFEMKDLSCTIR